MGGLGFRGVRPRVSAEGRYRVQHTCKFEPLTRRAEQVIGMRRAHPHAVLVLSTLARSAAQARDLIAVGGTNVRGTVTIAASASRPGRCVGGQLGFGSLQPWREVMCG
jgi:hypothetical protein